MNAADPFDTSDAPKLFPLTYDPCPWHDGPKCLLYVDGLYVECRPLDDGDPVEDEFWWGAGPGEVPSSEWDQYRMELWARKTIEFLYRLARQDGKLRHYIKVAQATVYENRRWFRRRNHPDNDSNRDN